MRHNESLANLDVAIGAEAATALASRVTLTPETTFREVREVMYRSYHRNLRKVEKCLAERRVEELPRLALALAESPGVLAPDLAAAS